MDPRTVRAVVVAALLGLGGIGGVAWFLGFDGGAALVAGVVAGLVCAGIVLAAAARGQSVGPSAPSPQIDPTSDDEVTGG